MGRACEALPQLRDLESLWPGDKKGHNEALGGIFIDVGTGSGAEHLVRRGVSLLAAGDVAGLSESSQSVHYYNLGNGYAQLYYLKKIASGVSRALDADFRLAKQCYRRAASLPAHSGETKARLYTNYGILLRTVGRHVEEIEAYDEALSAVPDFPMALWHKARGLCWYSRLVERPTKRSTLLEAWDLLGKSLDAGLEPTHRMKARQELAELERILKEPKSPAHKHTQHVARSDIEANYIKFCVDNRLYLHPCPIGIHRAYEDPLAVRLPTSTKDEFLELRSDELALIKQEYIAARFLLFSYRFQQPDLSFVERGTFLPSLKEGNGQIYLQFLILSFRAGFAVLDKIAFFLNAFCRLRHKDEGIYFRDEFFTPNGALRVGLVKYDGLQLAALVDLASDFSKDQPLYTLRDLRRKLEHRCMTVRRAADSGVQGAMSTQTPTDVLSEIELYESALRLLKAVRAAVFYLFYFVRRSIEPARNRPR